MPLQETSGAASYDAYGGGVAVAPVYIEDVMSTFLYTGNGSTQTITNGIDLSGKGGMVWTKSRSDIRDNNILTSGFSTFLVTNKTEAANTPTGLNSFNSNGYTLNGDTANNNQNGWTYASWTFRKQPKFFDVVTYTGDGVAGRSIPHSLGSVPGCIIIKATSTTGSWYTYHASLGVDSVIYLNLTNAATTASGFWGTPTSTNIVVGGSAGYYNASGVTYVAYLFAHNAGGFGLTGTDNVISCGSFTTGSGSGFVNIGFEPQWILTKRSNAVGSWVVVDVMRGMTVDNGSYAGDAILIPNTAAAEANSTYFDPQPTGFNFNTFGSSQTWIYIAIRRGPMKTPTSGTSVFAPVAYTGNGASSRTFTDPNFPPDLIWTKSRSNGTDNLFMDRLRGTGRGLITNDTSSEGSASGYYVTEYGQLGWTLGTADALYNLSARTYIAGAFRRAPGFFDEVCYTGTGSARTVNHNLGVVPELMIVKRRDSTGFWAVYSAATGAANVLELQSSAASTSGTAWNSTSPTASVFTVGNTVATGASGGTYVSYLFASCPGVSKCFSYTGNGSSQTINCGFTGGARFVMVKRTDSTGNWLLVDTARGLVSAGDPTLYLNSTAAEVTGVDWIDPDGSGFIVNQESTMNANVNGATYIGLAIA